MEANLSLRFDLFKRKQRKVNFFGGNKFLKTGSDSVLNESFSPEASFNLTD